MSFDPLLVSAFTRDPVAEKPSVCQTSSCQAVVAAGEPYIYVGRKDGKAGRFVCSKCYERLKAGPGAVTLSRDAILPALADTDQIRRSVNAAHSRNSINPPRVVAINNQPLRDAVVMPPPPLPRQDGGPHVRVPTAAWEAPEYLRAAILPNAVGYNSNHLMYHAERDRRARSAHASLAAETISLKIFATFENGKRGRSRSTAFGNICEGVRDVDARLTAPALQALALDTIVPCIRNFCPQFPWRSNEFIVRDDEWVDLAKYPDRSKHYFYVRCLQITNKKNAKGPLFKHKTFDLNVIVPQAQWQEYEAFKDRRSKITSTRTCSPTSVDVSMRSPTPEARPSHYARSSTPKAGPSHYARSPTPEISLPTRTRLHVSTREQSTHVSQPGTSSLEPHHFPPEASGRLFLPEQSDHIPASDAPKATQAIPANSFSKRTREHSAGVASITSKSPPSKRQVPPSGPVEVPSPSQKDIKEALQSGGTVLNVDLILNQTIQLVDFYPVSTLPFADIVKKGESSFDITKAARVSGQIRIDPTPNSLIGVGAFKTAQVAQLILTSDPPSGLGSPSMQTVVAKRPYNRQQCPDGKPPFPRYVIATELDKLLREVNVLRWAKSLLNLTYSFVDHAITQSIDSPSFNIPRLRFVETGLTLGYETSTGGGGTKAAKLKMGSVRIAYLVEETIPIPFVKFIHNATCRPLLDPDDPDYDIAEFLAFTQHVQYVKTRKMSYISDYQGNPPLLTDPQILTHPSVGDGANLFGDGNIEKAVEEFEKRHVCNRYCKWPGFKLAEFCSGAEKTTDCRRDSAVKITVYSQTP